MRKTILSVILVASCAHPSAWRGVDREERAQVAEQLDAFRDFWLAPAHLPAPPVELAEPTVRVDGVVGTLRRVRAEDEDWNQFPAGDLRLFNDRAAWMFAVHLTGTGEVRWVPEGSRLDVNVDDDPHLPASSPELLLQPLVDAARRQERWVLDGDLHVRLREARAFRAAYLPTSSAPVLDGVVAFPRRDGDGPVAAMRVTLQVEDDEGLHTLSWLFE